MSANSLSLAIATVKRRRLTRVLGACLARFLAGCGVGYSAAVYGSYLFSPEARVYVFSAFLLAGLAAGAISAVRAYAGLKPKLTDAEAAWLLAGGDAAVANVLVAGEDLSKWDEGKTASLGADPKLVKAAVAAAEAALPEAGRLAVGPKLSGDLQLAGIAIFATFLSAFYGPATDAQTVAQLVSGYSGKPISVGNISVAIYPPSYTGLPVTVEKGGTGDVKAYPGSKIEIRGVLSEPVDAGACSGPDRVESPVDLSADGFSTSFVALKNGTYNFRFYVKHIELPAIFEPRRVELIQDAAPTVELVEPASDMDAMNVEEIKVSWRAADDFGIESAAIVLSGTEEVRIPLKVAMGRSSSGEASFLPAAWPKLGDGAYLSVEAKDNDTVSGPKPGVSRSVYIAFNSPRKMAEELAALEERLMEAMLSLLADHLEYPTPSPEKLDAMKGGSRDLLTLVEALMKATGKAQSQELTRTAAVANIASTLTGVTGDWLNDPPGKRDVMVSELERDILFLDRMQREMRMEEALTLGDELSMLQRDLFDRIGKGEDAKSLLEAVNRIERTLAEIAKKLADKQSLPDDFANSDASKDPPKDALTSMLEELKEALKSGDRKRAAELAEQIMKELDKWLQNLQKAADGDMDSADSKTSKELDEIMRKVSEAIAEQERIMGETKRTGDELGRRAVEKMRQQMDAFMQRQRGRLDQIMMLEREMESSAAMGNSREPNTREWADAASSLNSERARIDSAQRQARLALDESLPEASRAAKKLEERAKSFSAAAENYATDPQVKERIASAGEKAAKLAAEIASDIDGLLAKRKESATEKERMELSGQGTDEGKLSSDIDRIRDQLNKLAKDSPFVDPGAGEKAGDAGKSAGEASKKLGQGDPYGAVPGQMSALEKLTELSGDLESMQQSMGGKKEGGKGRGTPRRPGGRGGKGDVDRSRVEIPGESESEQLKKLREEVMKTMGEGKYPKEYRPEIEKYFEGLIK